MTIAARADEGHGLRKKLRNSFGVKRRRNKVKSSVIQCCLKCFRILRRTNDDCANSDRRLFHKVDDIDPCAVGKFRVRKDQVRMSLLKQVCSLITTADAEGIHAQGLENRL